MLLLLCFYNVFLLRIFVSISYRALVHSTKLSGYAESSTSHAHVCAPYALSPFGNRCTGETHQNTSGSLLDLSSHVFHSLTKLHVRPACCFNFHSLDCSALFLSLAHFVLFFLFSLVLFLFVSFFSLLLWHSFIHSSFSFTLRRLSFRIKRDKIPLSHSAYKHFRHFSSLKCVAFSLSRLLPLRIGNLIVR